MKRSVLHVCGRPLLPTHTHTRLLTCAEVWANVFIPKIIIQYTFVSVDAARRGWMCPSQAGKRLPSSIFEGRQMWTVVWRGGVAM